MFPTGLVSAIIRSGLYLSQIEYFSIDDEMLYRITDEIREFASRTQKELPSPVQPLKKNENKARAFLSASFNDEIDPLISWFIEMIKSLEIDVIWLKKTYQARPTEEKIKENIRLRNCFIQVITRDVKEAGKEAGWLGNEIAWARDSTPDGNIAVFVEKGMGATGLAKVVADNLEFDRADQMRALLVEMKAYADIVVEQDVADQDVADQAPRLTVNDGENSETVAFSD